MFRIKEVKNTRLFKLNSFNNEIYFQKSTVNKFCPIKLTIQDMNSAIFEAEFAEKRVAQTPFVDLKWKGYCKGPNGHNNPDSQECL